MSWNVSRHHMFGGIKMKQILFVDDEPHILQEMEQSEHSFNEEWNMQFVKSGQEALEVMTRQKIDVLISDMQMLNMNGAELLEEVKSSYPNVVRIIVSEPSDEEVALKLTTTAHQFLSKPCDAASFTDTIQKAISRRDLLKSEHLSQVISQIGSLPSLPTLYTQIIERLNKEDASLMDIAVIIKKDVSMTAEILKLINSSFFGFFNKISNIGQAISLLGLNMIKTLVLSIKVFSQFSRQDQISISINELWEHSFLTAIFTSKIVFDYTKNNELKESAFTAGLLHDIGMVTFASQLSQKYKKTYDHAFINQNIISKSEYRFFETSHAEVGAYLVALWGFSDPITSAIANHHVQIVDDDNIDFLTLAVHLADVYAQKLCNKNHNLPLEMINKIVLMDRRYQENHEHWFNLCSEIYNQN
jgi:HD-like signal output (HDOD) protein